MLPTIPPATLTTQGTAEYFGCSVSHVRGLIRERMLPVVRLGRRVLVRLADADALLEQLAKQSVEPPGA